MRFPLVTSVLGGLTGAWRTVPQEEEIDLEPPSGRGTRIIELENPYLEINDPNELEILFSDIVTRFNAGFDEVLINIGHPMFVDLVGCDPNFASSVVSFLNDEDNLQRISEATGKNIAVFRGIRKSGETDIRYYEPHDNSPRLRENDTCFVVLRDIDRTDPSKVEIIQTDSYWTL